MRDQRWLGWFWVAAILGAIANSPAALAQPSNIVPDRSLGDRNSVVIPNDGGLPLERIGGGDQRGGNLFHSFQEFNVSNGRAAYFDQPQGVINILSRVTGKNPSQILGTLGVIGAANLFLINPNGIIFGPNASLDVGGAFVASTANAIRLGENGLFSASDPASSNLLSIQPSALFFNAFGQPKPIINQSTATSNVLGTSFNGDPQRAIYGLQVLDGQPLLLVGGAINMPGGSLSALDGRVELAAVGGQGNVGLVGQGQTLRLSLPATLARADISLSDQAAVYVTGQGTGKITIFANNLSLTQGSFLFAGLYSGQTLAPGNPGDIQIDTTQTLTLEGESGILNQIGNNSTPGAKAGDILIHSSSLRVVNSAIGSSTYAQGDAGNVIIQAQAVSLLNGGRIFSMVEPGGVGNAGRVAITTNSLTLTDGAYLSSSTFGQGNAGRIMIQAQDTVMLDGVGSGFSSAILSTVEPYGVGNGGDINITAKSLALTNGAFLSASTLGTGNAGNITLRTIGTVALDGVNKGFPSAIFSTVEQGAVGNGGDINITAQSLALTNGAFLKASTLGMGNAGNITLRTSETVALDGVSSNPIPSNVVTDVNSGAIGNGGDINITAKSLALTNGAFLSATTFGRGNAGNIRIQAMEAVGLDGVNKGFSSTIFSTVEQGAVGNGGNVNITAQSLSLTKGAALTTDIAGQGDAGNITLQITDAIAIDGVGSNQVVSGVYSSVRQEGSGQGGSIDIAAKSLTLTNGGSLRADTFGQGNAGNITLRATDAIAVDGIGGVNLASGAFSTVGQDAVGNGGDIDITTKSLALTNGAALSSSTFGRGNAGNITIQAMEAVGLEGTNQGFSSAIFSTVEQGAIGKGGNINITAKSLSLTKGAALAGNTFANGNAGNIFVQTSETVRLDGVGSNGVSSAIFSDVGPAAVGNGGNINITAQSLSLSNGAALRADTFGQGNAGNITVQATNAVWLDGVGSDGVSSRLLTQSAPGSSGRGGDITIKTGNFQISQGAVVNAQTSNSDPGGNITLTAETFTALAGGQLLTTTFSSGQAGTIALQVSDQVTLAGSDRTFQARLAQYGTDIVTNQGAASGLFANTAPNSSGAGGSIVIDPHQVTLRDGGTITVDSRGRGNGGNITLRADNLLLDNGASLSAATASGEGGNITLNVSNLLQMRQHSLISAEAKGTGNGGNIDLNTRFLVAAGNSDIVANAFEGRGGNIQITAQGLFGIQARDVLTPLSDINASSQFGTDGVVQVTTTVDPSSGLAVLPSQVIDASSLIAQGCRAAGSVTSKLVVSGRDGLPTNPGDLLSTEPVLNDLGKNDSGQSEVSLSFTYPVKAGQPKQQAEPMLEAEGWVVRPDGKVVLTAQNHQAQPTWFKTLPCPTD